RPSNEGLLDGSHAFYGLIAKHHDSHPRTEHIFQRPVIKANREFLNTSSVADSVSRLIDNLSWSQIP
ncbi:hypothetical protein, partial [Pseudomonas amygdali]|uniref:hypothetical protein n=1 Tax=Pseudomonas amygdali TaxID=47877 RepID=UPI001C119418